MEEELPRVVLAASDCVMNRAVGLNVELETESNLWQQSGQIPGVRIINTWEVYRNIWLVLTKTESGHYQILRSIDLQRYSMVHDHLTEIYNLFWLDDGHMIFCAADGWWVTTDTGLTWSALVLGPLVPKARSVAVVGLQEKLWSLVAYGEDHKLYHSDYPDGEWVMAYDTTAIWPNKWYPAIAGGPSWNSGWCRQQAAQVYQGRGGRYLAAYHGRWRLNKIHCYLQPIRDSRIYDRS